GPSRPECVPDAPYLDLPDGPMAGFFASLNEPIDLGFVIGAAGSGGLGPGGIVGFESVFDLYDFEADVFVYGGVVGWSSGQPLTLTLTITSIFFRRVQESIHVSNVS